MKTRTDLSGTFAKGLVAVAVAFATASGASCGVSGGSTGGPPSTGAAGASAGTGGTAQAGSTGSGGTSSGAAGVSGAAGSGPGAAGSTGAGGAAGNGSSGGTTGAAGTGTGGGAAGADAGVPLSGIMVNIGGTMVAKENAIAFLNFGHSNMAGRGVSLATTRPYFFGAPDPHGWMYHSGAGFQPAVEPKTAGDSGNEVNGMVSGGPSTALVKEAAALAPDKYFITVGFGAGMAYCSQFLPGALYYDQMMKGAREIKDKVTWAGIVVMLGITERHGTQADITNYPQCMNTLITSIRTELNLPNLPLLLNDYEMGTTGPLAPVPSDAFFVAIEPKILMVPSVVSNAVIIPTDKPIIPIEDDLSTDDDHHFSLAGHEEYARRLLQTMKDNGWFPW